MRFGVVELTTDTVTKTGRNWKRMRDEVEDSSPSRWDNPVLVVLPDRYQRSYNEGEIPEEYIRDNVVAVPHSEWGYGTNYEALVNPNRRRFGLSGVYTPVAPGGYGFMAEEEHDEEQRIRTLRRKIGDETLEPLWTPERLLDFANKRSTFHENIFQQLRELRESHPSDLPEQERLLYDKLVEQEGKLYEEFNIH